MSCNQQPGSRPLGGPNGNIAGCGGGNCGYGDLGHCGTPCCCCPCGDIKNTIVPIQLDRCCRPCKVQCGCGPACCPTRCPDPNCMNLGSPQIALGCGKCICPPRERREKRWPNCNFIKPCLDLRVYRNGEHMCISYSGHVPGEQFIHGRNLPTSTTFAKRRLCSFTPYEYVDADGCCSVP